MRLYDINGAIAQLAEMLEEGEIDEQVYNDTVEGLGTELAVEDVVKAIRNKTAEADALKAEVERLSDKKRRAEAAVDGLKNILLTYLTTTGQKKTAAGMFTVSRGSSKSVEITDEAQIPEEFLIAQPPKVDKKAILAELKNGGEIAGAQLRESEHVTIR
jgi:hypothetical protein